MESPALLGPAFEAFGRLRGGACRASGDNAPGEAAAMAFDGGWEEALGGGGGAAWALAGGGVAAGGGGMGGVFDP